MDLREKKKSVKVYSETKSKLVKLLNEFLSKYEECDETCEELYAEWKKNLEQEFKTIFKTEGFDIKEGTRPNSCDFPVYDSEFVSAIFNDLEFELCVDYDSAEQIKLSQKKPFSDRFSVSIYPNFESYIVDFEIDLHRPYVKKRTQILSAEALEQQLENVKNAEYTIETMENLYDKVNIEMDKLLEKQKQLNTTTIKYVASINGKKDYEFTHLSELIEVI